MPTIKITKIEISAEFEANELSQVVNAVIGTVIPTPCTVAATQVNPPAEVPALPPPVQETVVSTPREKKPRAGFRGRKAAPAHPWRASRELAAATVREAVAKNKEPEAEPEPEPEAENYSLPAAAKPQTVSSAIRDALRSGSMHRDRIVRFVQDRGLKTNLITVGALLCQFARSGWAEEGENHMWSITPRGREMP